jgi:hypothetical protein
MGTSTRFAVGVHLLPALAANPGKVLRSEDVADSANSNPVVVRRLFSPMTTASALGSVLEAVSNWRRRQTTSLYAMSSLRWRAPSIGPPRAHPVRSPPYPPCSAGADSACVAAQKDELSRATIADLAGALFARSKDAQGAETVSSQATRRAK